MPATTQSQPVLHVTRETRLLFIGDSITDCGRSNDKPEGLGSGYVRLIRDDLACANPETSPHVINRGISGNKITDLSARWERDVVASDPHVLSIMIGINDVWHGLMPNLHGVSIEDYTAIYRDLMQRTKKSLPNCRIVLMEPTVIYTDARPNANELLQPYIAAVNAVAREFSDTVMGVVHTHKAFVDAIDARDNIKWTNDGVHPTSTGHMLLARLWLAEMHLL